MTAALVALLLFACPLAAAAEHLTSPPPQVRQFPADLALPPSSQPGPVAPAPFPQTPVRLPGQRNPFAGCLIKSLSLRFDEEMQAHRWAPIYAKNSAPALAPVPFKAGDEHFDRTVPVHLRFIDAASGEAWDAVPDRMARSGGMFSVLRGGDAIRFYAGSLVSTNGAEILEWHVLSDDQPKCRVYHVQIAAPLGAPRRLRAQFWLGDTSAAEIGTIGSSTPLIDVAGIPVWLDLSEPRRFRALHARGGTCGYEFDLAATPATGNFPCTAAFAVTVGTRSDAFPSDAYAAPDRLPLPDALLAGDWADVLSFAPCTYDLPAENVPDALPDGGHPALDDEAFLSALDAAIRVPDLVRSEWASSAFQALVIPPGAALARRGARGCWVNPDPDLPSILSIGPNRAQAILYAIQSANPAPKAVCLDFGDLHAAPVDTRERAIYLCDFPLVWTDSDNPVSALGVRLGDAACEFAATLACALHRRGIPLLIAADPEDPAAPFLLYHADGLVVPPDVSPSRIAPFASSRPILQRQ